MENLNIENFDPTVEQLQKIVEKTKDINVTNLKDKEQISIVRSNRINLRDARVSITKKGKQLREDAIAFQKKVIEKEKELIAIIEPEETRLANIEEEAKQLVIREERLLKLPLRRQRIIDLNVGVGSDFDEITLGMDDEQFEAYFNKIVAEINEQNRIKALEEQVKKEADLKRQEEEVNKKLEELRAEEQKKIEAEKKKIEEERAELFKKEQELQAEKNRIIAEEEAKKKAEEDRLAKEAILEKRELYRSFLKDHGWTEESKLDFKVEETVDGYILFKKVGIFKK